MNFFIQSAMWSNNYNERKKIQVKFDITIQNWIIQVTSEKMSMSQQTGAFLCLLVNYS